jgi:hypothetical protein
LRHTKTGILGGDALVASYLAESLHDAVARDTEFLECFRVVGRREEKVLDGDKVVLNSFGWQCCNFQSQYGVSQRG